MQRWISVIVVLLLIILVIGLMMPAVEQSREAARRSTSKNNLKQLGLAVANYHDSHKCLPPGGVIREDDVAMHGWFSMILPYLDQSDDYSRINFSEPWDQDENRAIYEKSRPVFIIPVNFSRFTSQGYGLTNYLGNPNLLYRNSNVSIEQMSNGTSHTWLAGEVAGNFQPWGYPFNWRPLGTKLCNGPNSFGHPPLAGRPSVVCRWECHFLFRKHLGRDPREIRRGPTCAHRRTDTSPGQNFRNRRFLLEQSVLAVRSPGGTAVLRARTEGAKRSATQD